MTHIAIVLARLDSSRLPGKALRRVLDRPLIGYALERAKQVRSLSKVVLATTDRVVDDPLAAFAREAGVSLFRGATENVAQRCLDCARQFGADHFVRLNGDSPFPDPALIEEGLQALRREPPPDLVTNLVDRTYPYGVSVEIVRAEALARCLPRLTTEEAEHVTLRLYARENLVVLSTMHSPNPELSRARMVVDTEEDLERFARVAGRLGARVLRAGFAEVAAEYLCDSQT